MQVRFAASITDGPDIDLFVAGYGVTAKPQVTLVGPNDERLDLVPTVSKDTPAGFTVISYDLSDTALPFVARDVCITGVTGRVNATPFALRMVRVLTTGAEDSGGSVSGS